MAGGRVSAPTWWPLTVQKATLPAWAQHKPGQAPPPPHSPLRVEGGAPQGVLQRLLLPPSSQARRRPQVVCEERLWGRVRLCRQQAKGCCVVSQAQRMRGPQQAVAGGAGAGCAAVCRSRCGLRDSLGCGSGRTCECGRLLGTVAGPGAWWKGSGRPTSAAHRRQVGMRLQLLPHRCSHVGSMLGLLRKLVERRAREMSPAANLTSRRPAASECAASRAGE